MLVDLASRQLVHCRLWSTSGHCDLRLSQQHLATVCSAASALYIVHKIQKALLNGSLQLSFSVSELEGTSDMANVSKAERRRTAFLKTVRYLWAFRPCARIPALNAMVF